MTRKHWIDAGLLLALTACLVWAALRIRIE
jgi:hypothetical protein